MTPASGQHLKKIVLVVDVRNWAFDTVARSVQKRLSPQFHVDILYWEDFARPEKLMDMVTGMNPDLVHFFFREHLYLLMQLMDRRSRSARVFCSRAITTHVPDYLHHDQTDLFNRKHAFDLVDGYFTTNADLFGIYSSCSFIPKPFGVIHDWIDVDSSEQPAARSDDTVRILWSGNSKWGEYAGHVDYKGLHRVILPAVRAVQRKFPHVEFICHDSAKKRVPHSTIMHSMRQADILLIASQKEGTPLTLIEAMANGCAVVTTRVGIAPEILPEEQLEFISDATPFAFQERLERLVSNRDLIARLAGSNQRVWQQHFGDDGPLRVAWVGFINHALKRYAKEGPARKLALLPDRDAFARRMTVNTLRLGARFANRLGLVNSINRASPRIGATYHRIVYGSSQGRVDYSVVAPIYENVISERDETHPLVVYAPMWKGVAASTEAIFPDNRIRFPFTDSEYPEQETHPYMDSLAEKLSAAEVPAIVYSGGSLIHLALAREVRKRNRDMPQFFMWHGSPAQWIDNRQLEFFNQWRDAYGTGIIDGMLVLKRNLDRTLQHMGIWSSYIFNPVPSTEEGTKPRTLDPNHVGVGLFSSMGSWYKNLFPQLLALAGMENVTLTTSIPQSEISLTKLDIGRVNCIEHMSHSSFLQVLAQQDVNLYVTNTECSPMIPAESWAYLVPCIVGPAGDIYSPVCKELGTYLVEPRVDDPQAIRDRLERVLENYDHITDLLHRNRDRQRELFLRQRTALFESLLKAPRRSLQRTDCVTHDMPPSVFATKDRTAVREHQHV